jgi:Major Facilitator Superfamily
VQVRTIGAAAGGPAVRRLAAGMLLSRTGDQLTTIALVWFVLDLTGSGLAVGLVLLCAGLPPVVTGPLLGRLLDRWPPRRVMVADNLARAALVAAIPALHWLGRLDMALLYGLSVAAGALVPATDVGVRVALPRLVEEADLERANLLLSVGDQVSALAGPALGGLLVGLVGAPPVLLADAASFLAMAALVRRLPDRRPGRPAAGRPPGDTGPGRRPGGARRPRPHPGLLPGLRAARAGPAPVQPRRAGRRGGRQRATLVGVRGGRPGRAGHRPAGGPPAPRPRPGRERPGLGSGPPAPARRQRHRPGHGRARPGRAGLGPLRHPGGVPAPARGPGRGPRPGVRGPPGPDRRGRPPGRGRRRAPAPAGDADVRHRPVRVTCAPAGTAALCVPALHRLPARRA